MGSKLTKLANRLDAIEMHLGLQNEDDKPTERKCLEVGKWYFSQIDENLLVYIVDKESRFGISKYNTWFDTMECFENLENDGYTEATPQEVEKVLIEEANRRGFGFGVTINHGHLSINYRKEDLHIPLHRSFEFNEKYNSLWLGGIVIFKDGQWATIIEKDKFAELKEAHKNGAMIQFKNASTFGKWLDLGSTIAWYPENEYRIKPEEKPKVGDVVKAWNDDEGQYFIGIVHEIASHGEFQVKFRKGNNFSGYYFFAKNAKTLNEQEAIELLFGKENSK